MRRRRRIRRWEFNKLVRARVLKINYVWNKRTSRKYKNKNRYAIPGLMKVGQGAYQMFGRYLAPTLKFSYNCTNSVMLTSLPSKLLVKRTNPTPLYQLPDSAVGPIIGRSIPSLIPSRLLSFTPGFKLALWLNSKATLKRYSSFQVKSLFYGYSYLLAVKMIDKRPLRLVGPQSSNNYTRGLLGRLTLLSLYFYF